MDNERSKTYEFLRSFGASREQTVALIEQHLNLLEAVYALGRHDGHGEHNECLEIGVCDAANQAEEALARCNLDSRKQTG